MSDCLDNTQCYPVASQAFPAPLPEGIPADAITYAFEGVCPGRSGLDQCKGVPPITVSKALDLIEAKLCALNPRGITLAPDCSPIVVKGGVATPVTALQALNCLPKSNAGDVPQFNGAEWIVGPILRETPDCSYPCPPAPNLVLTSTGVNTATWQSFSGGSGPPQTPISTVNTNGIALDLTASVLKATAIVSPDAGNLLQVTPNGFKVIAPASGGPTTVSNTTTTRMTLTGSNITTDVILDPDPKNAIVATPNGLLVTIPSAATTKILGGSTPGVANTAQVNASGDIAIIPSLVISPAVGNALSLGPNGLYAAAGSSGGSPATTVTAVNTTSVKTTATTTGTSVQIKSDVILDPVSGNALILGPNGLSVAIPAGSAPLTAANSATVSTAIVSNILTSKVNIDPATGNKLKATSDGLIVGLPTCAEVLAFSSPASASGCVPESPSCALPSALMGHGGSTPSYYVGKPLYSAEVYPTSVPTFQDLSTTRKFINEITSLMSLNAGDENGLCLGEASFWDPTLSRFTITRAGRYTYHWALFMRVVMSNNLAASNSSLYAGMRFIRPAGSINGRTVSAQATTLRGTQWTLNAASDVQTQDFVSTGSHTFVATAGTQLSLRAVAVPGDSSVITSFIVRGDSGHLSLSELPDRQF